MKKLTEYFELQKEIFDYFGYKEDWRVIPMSDCRKYYWYVTSEDSGEVHFADSETELINQTGQYFVDEIYTQRFLNKWVYRGKNFTMICTDPHTDGNKFLSIFDNDKERKPNALSKA